MCPLVKINGWLTLKYCLRIFILYMLFTVTDSANESADELPVFKFSDFEITLKKK